MPLFQGKKLHEQINKLEAKTAKQSARIKELEAETAAQSEHIEELEASLNPDLKEKEKLKKELDSLRDDSAKLNEKKELLEFRISNLEAAIKNREEQLTELDDEVLVEEFGLYRPTFEFANSTKYQEKLKEIRAAQRDRIKRFNAEAGKTRWTVDNDATKGKQMVRETSRLMMRAFNNECDDQIRRVKSANIAKVKENITKLAQRISKLGSVMRLRIPLDYLDLKLEEADLAYGYALAKEEEREAIREAKALEREERKVQKEIEAKRRDLRKEQKKYQAALDDIMARLKSSDGEEKNALQIKADELQGNLEEVKKGIEDVDYREANKRAGYVYIISNIGSFGKDVFKIGMTRRLEPMERIRELGDASVPFNFDVHALIFSDDAPSLEAALHKEFADRKINLVNQRREFFRCSLDEIKDAVIRNYDKTVDFIDVPDAEQYRVSEKMRNSPT